MSEAVVRAPGEGQVRLGAITLKVGAADTDGALTVAEYVVPPNWGGPPPHIHETAEWFLVVEGDLMFSVNGQPVDGKAGTFVFVPGGVPHGFSNPGDTPAKMYFFLMPGGFENYFAELEDALEGKFPPDAETAARVIPPLMAKYGVRTA